MKFSSQSPLRPGIVFAVVLVTAYAIGKSMDKPIEGMVFGMAAGSIINGVIDYSETLPPSNV